MEDLSAYAQSNLLYTQENLLRYRPGGYHPVCLGDTFKNGRYKIYHKLGWGGFSTVWLANDRKSKRWVSIKIITADSTKPSQELRNFQTLARHLRGSPCSKFIVQLLDHFVHEGPNGSHQCLVLELLGPTTDSIVSDYHEFGDPLEPETILRMSEQLLQGVAFLHEAGYVHGDISGRNVAFTCKRLSQATEKRLFKVLGTPEVETLTRIDGKPLDKALPTRLVKASDWDAWVEEDDENLRIIDLGEAFLQGSEPKKLAQPCSLQGPETIFANSFDYRLDLWRAGCTIYSFVFGAIPFMGLDMESLVAQMVGFVEELPKGWQQKWELMQVHSGYTRIPLTGESPSRLEHKFAEKVQEEALQPMLCVIQGLMRFMPSDRISASQALDLFRPNSGVMRIAEEAADWTDDSEGEEGPIMIQT